MPTISFRAARGTCQALPAAPSPRGAAGQPVWTAGGMRVVRREALWRGGCQGLPRPLGGPAVAAATAQTVSRRGLCQDSDFQKPTVKCHV